MLLRQPDVTHVACAFDHVITSFRNDLFEGYKDGTGIPEELASQFSLAEDAVRALGIVVWPMVEFEADDALATAAVRWQNAEDIEQIVICSPDKDLCQVVSGDKVVCLDRRREIVLDEPSVIDKFGVAPPSIPDYLALVGDNADGIPGIPRWGASSTATILEFLPPHRGHTPGPRPVERESPWRDGPFAKPGNHAEKPFSTRSSRS